MVLISCTGKVCDIWFQTYTSSPVWGPQAEFLMQELYGILLYDVSKLLLKCSISPLGVTWSIKIIAILETGLHSWSGHVEPTYAKDAFDKTKGIVHVCMVNSQECWNGDQEKHY